MAKGREFILVHFIASPFLMRTSQLDNAAARARLPLDDKARIVVNRQDARAEFFSAAREIHGFAGERHAPAVIVQKILLRNIAVFFEK
jgi:hypothetical protein